MLPNCKLYDWNFPGWNFLKESNRALKKFRNLLKLKILKMQSSKYFLKNFTVSLLRGRN